MIPRRIANRLRNPRIGSRTGEDVRAGKNIRKNKLGLDIFEDYLTDVDDSDSSNSLPKTPPKLVRSPPQRMSPFSSLIKSDESDSENTDANAKPTSFVKPVPQRSLRNSLLETQHRRSSSRNESSIGIRQTSTPKITTATNASVNHSAKNASVNHSVKNASDNHSVKNASVNHSVKNASVNHSVMYAIVNHSAKNSSNPKAILESTPKLGQSAVKRSAERSPMFSPLPSTNRSFREILNLQSRLVSSSPTLSRGKKRDLSAVDDAIPNENNQEEEEEWLDASYDVFKDLRSESPLNAEKGSKNLLPPLKRKSADSSPPRSSRKKFKEIPIPDTNENQTSELSARADGELKSNSSLSDRIAKIIDERLRKKTATNTKTVASSQKTSQVIRLPSSGSRKNVERNRESKFGGKHPSVDERDAVTPFVSPSKNRDASKRSTLEPMFEAGDDKEVAEGRSLRKKGTPVVTGRTSTIVDERDTVSPFISPAKNRKSSKKSTSVPKEPMFEAGDDKEVAEGRSLRKKGTPVVTGGPSTIVDERDTVSPFISPAKNRKIPKKSTSVPKEPMFEAGDGEEVTEGRSLRKKGTSLVTGGPSTIVDERDTVSPFISPSKHRKTSTRSTSLMRELVFEAGEGKEVTEGRSHRKRGTPFLVTVTPAIDLVEDEFVGSDVAEDVGDGNDFVDSNARKSPAVSSPHAKSSSKVQKTKEQISKKLNTSMTKSSVVKQRRRINSPLEENNIDEAGPSGKKAGSSSKHAGLSGEKAGPSRKTNKIQEMKPSRVGLNEPGKNSEGLRRSQRRRMPILEYWRFQKALYDPSRNLKAVLSPEVTEGPRFVTRHNHKMSSRQIALKKKNNRQSDRNNYSSAISDSSGLEETPVTGLPIINPETMEEVLVDVLGLKTSRNFTGPDGLPATAKDPFIICVSVKQMAFTQGDLVIRPKAEKPMQYLKRDTLAFHVLSGKLLLTVHRTTCLVRSGDAFFVPSGNRFSIKNLKNSTAHLYYTKLNGIEDL